MTQTEIDASELLPSERLQDKAIEGDVTQIHRGDKHASKGDVFEIDSVRFEVVEVREERLGEMTDADARAEGSRNIEKYKRRVERVHGIEWNDEHTAFLHRFEKID